MKFLRWTCGAKLSTEAHERLPFHAFSLRRIGIMTRTQSSYPVVPIRGNRRQIGQALGELAAPLMADYLAQSETWAALRVWRGHARLQTLAQHMQQRFPAVWEELTGLAQGLDMVRDDVLLWNCRGDLLHQTCDGCTSVALKAANGTRWMAHNEDGDPWLYGRCSLVDVRIEDDEHPAPGYLSFYYPGSLPGHTFAANRAGLVQTINNLRTCRHVPGAPRMALSRAVLDCTSLDAALALLRETPCAGGFHHMLGSTQDARLFSVEVAPGAVSVQEVAAHAGHANHMVHPAMQAQPQIVSDSSRARQQRIDTITRDWSAQTQADDLLTALHDKQDDFPVLRTDAQDPDGENTLATALFEIGENAAVRLSIYDRQDTAARKLLI